MVDMVVGGGSMLTIEKEVVTVTVSVVWSVVGGLDL